MASEKAKAIQRAYYLRHREKELERQQRYRDKKRSERNAPQILALQKFLYGRLRDEA